MPLYHAEIAPSLYLLYSLESCWSGQAAKAIIYQLLSEFFGMGQRFSGKGIQADLQTTKGHMQFSKFLLKLNNSLP